MNKVFLSLLLIVLCKQSVFCQQTNKIEASEFIQILDMYFSKLNQEDFFYSSVYAVKLFRAEHDSYSVVISSICYVDELPSDSLIFIELQDIKLFILSPSEIEVSTGFNNNLHFVTDEKEIKKKASSNLYKGGVKYYPFIVIFTASKIKCFSKSRSVRYETFLPIKNAPKKYWPIEKPIGAIVDQLPRDKAYDIYGNLKEEWKRKFENGKGNFRIKAR